MLKRIARKIGVGHIALQSRRLVTGEWQRERAQRLAAQEQQQDVEKRVAKSRSYFASIKGKFAGQRGFVIGNGPSLKLADLEKIKDEVTLAANKVYLAFDKVSWRPNFVTVVDALVWSKVQNEIWNHHDAVLIPSYLPELAGAGGLAKTFKALGDASKPVGAGQKLPFSDDLSIGAFGGYTVTYENLQLAVHLGLNPIYIIGCDHFYKGETKLAPNTPIATKDANNHFLPGYRAPGEIVNPATIDEMDASFLQARRFAESRGIRIINATRGGSLEVFERDDFDRIVR
jgi:hypothetical protein